MNICWDHFLNQNDTTEYVSGADGRDNRHIQFVREFASVISVLQVGSCVYLPLSCPDASGRYRTKRTMRSICTRRSYAQWKTSRRARIPLKRSQSYWARCRLPCAPHPLSVHYHKADGPADQPPEPGRIREPRTLGCRARQADRGDPSPEADAYHSSVVCRV